MEKKKDEEALAAADKAAQEGTDNQYWRPGMATQYRAKGGIINPMRFVAGGFAKGSSPRPSGSPDRRLARSGPARVGPRHFPLSRQYRGGPARGGRARSVPPVPTSPPTCWPAAGW